MEERAGKGSRRYPSLVDSDDGATNKSQSLAIHLEQAH